jgi:hypothetical protein
MLSSSMSRISAVWLALIALTVVSYALGSSHGLPAADHDVVGIVILTVALFKARLVGLHFMELRTAPLVLRCGFEVFCVALLVVLVTFFLV